MTVTGVPLPGRDIRQVATLSDVVITILADYQGDKKECGIESYKPPVDDWDKDRVVNILARLFIKDNEWQNNLTHYLQFVSPVPGNLYTFSRLMNNIRDLLN